MRKSPPAKDSVQKASAGQKKAEAFVQQIFLQAGEKRQLSTGEKLIEQGRESEKMFFIESGNVVLILQAEDGSSIELARRGPGEVLGELSMLLGLTTTNAAVAEGPLTVIEVEQTKLLALLADNPIKVGQLFKVVATYLSERISELSGKMRNNVVTSQVPAKTSQMPSADISRARQTFGLEKDAQLIGVYQCSVRREMNAIKEANAHFGELYLFESHLCFDLKMFAFHKQMVLDAAEIVSFLKSSEEQHCVEVQSKGQSIEVLIPDGFEEAIIVMEACRVKAKAALVLREQSSVTELSQRDEEAAKLEDFKTMVEPIISTEKEKQASNKLVDLELKEEDWKHFLSVAKQRTYKKGEYVLTEGQATATLYQIVRGRLRVELVVAGQAAAVVVGYRSAGEMLGETSLLKEGRATASIAADEDTTVICIEGKSLEQLFATHPALPSRFFCFLASYQADRLYKQTQSMAESKSPSVTVPMSMRLSIGEVMGNQAFIGIIRKFIKATAEDSQTEDATKFKAYLQAFDLYVAAQDYAYIVDPSVLQAEAEKLTTKYISDRKSTSNLEFILDDTKMAFMAEMDKFKSKSLSTSQARKLFEPISQAILTHLESECFEAFLASSHYRYILDIKAKEDIVPSLDDFKVIRVLGEGGFGQVIDVVKRDCGCHYAMKVMQKEVMKQNLGSSWRRKIASEQQIMSILNHPFMVNLKYAFQNSEFLILVMDLVPSGDLSEFVLTKRRLTPEQVRWAVMEVVEVMAYVHSQSILYRDLKPENLLVDDEGHVRLIDMGLAARIDEKHPYRTSRVGTDCYMAPEVRWARRRRQPYGKSADWYTIGVLLYEFTHGALPFSSRDTEQPIYRGGQFPTKECQSLCENLLSQSHKDRIGSGPTGSDEVKGHEYFKGIDWDIVAACKIPSPMKGVKGVPKRKKDKEMQAQRTAGDIAEADKADVDEEQLKEYNIDSWNFVSPSAITEEYMESVYACVSSI